MKKMSLLTALIAAVAISAYSVSGTYAKYTSATEGTATARVAKWNISHTNGGTQMSNTFDFDLFKTINDTTGAEETDVKKGGTGLADTDEGIAIIAPGTKGEFSMDFWNNSEVNSSLKVEWTENNTGMIPVEYKGTFTYWDETTGANVTKDAVTGKDVTALTDDEGWTSNINDIKIADSYKMLMGKSATLKIEWRWAYASTKGETVTDGVNYDTSLGLAGTAKLSLKAKVVATQID